MIQYFSSKIANFAVPRKLLGVIQKIDSNEDLIFHFLICSICIF